jgi:transcriptional regulator with XRE-family HTH domain
VSIAERFGRNLFMARRRAGLSQEQVADQAELHRTAISLLETGQRLPRLDTLVKLKAVVGVTADELLRGIEWRPTVIREGRFRTGTLGEP